MSVLVADDDVEMSSQGMDPIDMLTSDLDLTVPSLDVASDGFQERTLQALDELAVTRDALGLIGAGGADNGNCDGDGNSGGIDDDNHGGNASPVKDLDIAHAFDDGV